MRGSPRSRARAASLLALAMTTAGAAACAGDGGGGSPTPIPPTLTVEYVFPASPDPLSGIEAWRVTLTSAGTVTFAEEFAPGEPVTFRVEPMPEAVLMLEGCPGSGCSAGVLGRGRTMPFAITGEDQSVRMWFGRVNTFHVVNGTYLARTAPAVTTFPDGAVLLAGGRAGGVPTAVSDLYRPDLDRVEPTEALPVAISGGVAVPLDATTLLLAGGLDGSGNARTDAFVYRYATGTSTGGWTTATAMAQARSDATGATLGNGRALLAGGENGNTMRASTEIFRWDGAQGSWEAGPTLSDPVVGALAMPAGTNAALVGCGWSESNQGNVFKQNLALISSSGGAGWTRMNAGDSFFRARAWSSVLPVAPGEWLVVGGLNGQQPPYTSTRQAERVVWDGTTATITTAGRTAFGVRHGGGGRFADGRLVFLGGDTSSLDETEAPVDQALVHDGDTGEFTGLGATPGPTARSSIVPLADGTTLVVTDLGLFRFNP